eukprot:11426719-Alexandrium_andersonii.AAC.1
MTHWIACASSWPPQWRGIIKRALIPESLADYIQVERALADRQTVLREEEAASGSGDSSQVGHNTRSPTLVADPAPPSTSQASQSALVAPVACPSTAVPPCLSGGSGRLGSLPGSAPCLLPPDSVADGSNSVQPTAPGHDARQFACSQCGASFASKAAVTMHERVKCNVRSFSA